MCNKYAPLPNLFHIQETIPTHSLQPQPHKQAQEKQQKSYKKTLNAVLLLYDSSSSLHTLLQIL